MFYGAIRRPGLEVARTKAYVSIIHASRKSGISCWLTRTVCHKRIAAAADMLTPPSLRRNVQQELARQALGRPSAHSRGEGWLRAEARYHHQAGELGARFTHEFLGFTTLREDKIARAATLSRCSYIIYGRPDQLRPLFGASAGGRFSQELADECIVCQGGLRRCKGRLVSGASFSALDRRSPEIKPSSCSQMALRIRSWLHAMAFRPWGFARFVPWLACRCFVVLTGVWSAFSFPV